MRPALSLRHSTRGLTYSFLWDRGETEDRQSKACGVEAFSAEDGQVALVGELVASPRSMQRGGGGQGLIPEHSNWQQNCWVFWERERA